MNFMKNDNDFNEETFRKAVAIQVNIPQNKLAEDETFKTLSKEVKNYTKVYKLSNKYKQTLNEKGEKLEKIYNNFIEKNVRPEYKHSTATLLSEYTKKQLDLNSITTKEFNIDKWVDFRAKIADDLNRYHYLRYPEELLDRYTELCAKDSEITKAKTPQEKILLETELQFAKTTLKEALAYASLIEMQEILVESASELGNPALATKKFKNYDSEYADPNTGTVYTLADPKIINIMVRALLNSKTIETCIMFIEKLGLTDQFVEQEDNIFNVEKTKKKINKITNILKTTNKQIAIFDAELSKFNNQMNTEEFLKQIDDSKEIIIKKTQNLSRKKNVRAMLADFDNIKNLVMSNPDLPKMIVLKQTMNELKRIIIAYTNDDISTIQKELNELNTIHELIMALNIPEYRAAYKAKESFVKKFNEIENYRNKTIQETIAKAQAINIT